MFTGRKVKYPDFQNERGAPLSHAHNKSSNVKWGYGIVNEDVNGMGAKTN